MGQASVSIVLEVEVANNDYVNSQQANSDASIINKDSNSGVITANILGIQNNNSNNHNNNNNNKNTQ